MPAAPPERRRARPNVVSVPAGVPFLETLVDGLLEGGLIGHGFPGLRNDPLSLSDVRIFLPTRRAVREIEAIFATKLGGAAILPRISALGEFDEEEDAFEQPASEHGEEGLPEAIGEIERRLALAALINRWAEALAKSISAAEDQADLISTTPSEAISLAVELGRLIDSFETHGAKWTEIAPLIPPEHDEVWRLTARFLDIAAAEWPKFLEAGGKKRIGAAARQNLQLRALAERLERGVPTTPVIIAGSTGSNPATAGLMKIVARLPNGLVVLPGLDIAADDEAWAEIGGENAGAFAAPQAWTHPQHAFHRLLRTLEIQRGEVGLLGREDKARDRRRASVSAALLPSDLTDRWAIRPADVGTALDGLALIEAANEREEALAVALALVDALRVPGKTAALITPDRPLARRVAAELRRFGVEAEDSAGLPLAESRTGILAGLVAEAALHQLAPHALLPLLRHPDAVFGLDDRSRRRAVDAIEIGVLRGPSPPPGIVGLKRALELNRSAAKEERRFWHPTKRALGTEDWAAVADLILRVEAALGPLCNYGTEGRKARLGELLVAHRAALDGISGESLAGPDANALLSFFDEALAANPHVDCRLADYPSVFKALLRGKTARGAQRTHPRLRILGTLEARLLGFDRVVLGGLNEGTWPAQAKNDAFLSRPMRSALGLPPPEWRVGLSAHDFEQALGGNDVVLSRSLKAGGAPSVAARWLQRLEAVAGASEWDKVSARGKIYLAYAAETDRASTKRMPPPKPAPPRALRPDGLSVTEIETLIRDPYAIYARHVLRLRPLDPLGQEPGAADRGTIIHGVLAEFIAKGDVFSDTAEAELISLGRAAFEPIWDFPDVRALWWPRFERIARWCIHEWERPRRAVVARIYTEMKGELSWQTQAGRTVTLSGRADRLDELKEGGYSVVDYKTGSLPGHGEVLCGLAPQLPLEAAMLAEGAFAEPGAGIAQDFTYVRLSGQATAGEKRPINLDGRSAEDVARDALNELKKMIDRFEDEAQPYRSGTHPKFKRRPNGEYDHLARHAEWGLSPEIEDGGE